MNQKKSIDKRKFLIFLVVSLFTLAVTNAAVLTFFGQVTQQVTVEEAISFTGVNAADATVQGGESVTSNDLLVESLTSVGVPLSIETSVSPSADIIPVTQYLLDNTGGVCGGGSPTCEKRVFVQASDLGIQTLNDLSTISWDAEVSGYLPHVDVFLNNGEVLVFEYAKVDPSQCDNAPYPTGSLNTFDDKGIVDDSAYAWLSSGPPGPCGDSTFDANHKSLADWKTTFSGVGVLGFELEVDNWILESNSVVSDIMVNGNQVEVSLLSGDSLAFNVETTFDVTTSADTYTLTTTVEPRI